MLRLEGAPQLTSHPAPADGSNQPPKKLGDASLGTADLPICFTLLLREAKDSAQGKENLRRYLASVADATDAILSSGALR
jgi:hypothetical protein